MYIYIYIYIYNYYEFSQASGKNSAYVSKKLCSPQKCKNQVLINS